MLEYLQKESNITFTQNGAVTLQSTGSDCLDFFATAGAMRFRRDPEIIHYFIRAYSENPDTAMKTLFFARDVRAGLGERRLFRILFAWLADNHPESVRKNIEYVAEFGRYDDLLTLLDTACETEMLAYLKTVFDKDMENHASGKNVSLLGKWLPSINASNHKTIHQAKKVANAFGLTPAQYRKACTALRADIRILENNLREKDYTFDYEKQTSRSMFKYRAAFYRNDKERYTEFLDNVRKGNAVLHTQQVYPYELVDPYLDFYPPRHIREEEKLSLNTTWAALPNYCKDDNTLAVIDTSASMYGGGKPRPVSVAFSLGIYFAEHNTGAFHNHFMTFSERPKLVELKGETFSDRLQYLLSYREAANTNIEAVFDLVLKTAVKHNVPQEELPSRILIISDMEFDSCTRNSSLSNFENARRNFEACGYRLPDLVFWNVDSMSRQQPVSANEQGAILVSGCTPRIFEMVAEGTPSPEAYMQEVLSAERYACIKA